MLYLIWILFTYPILFEAYIFICRGVFRNLIKLSDINKPWKKKKLLISIKSASLIIYFWEEEDSYFSFSPSLLPVWRKKSKELQSFPFTLDLHEIHDIILSNILHKPNRKINMVTINFSIFSETFRAKDHYWTFNFWKSTIETLEKGGKYVES